MPISTTACSTTSEPFVDAMRNDTHEMHLGGVHKSERSESAMHARRSILHLEKYLHTTAQTSRYGSRSTLLSHSRGAVAL